MAKSDLGNQNVDTSQRESLEAGVDEYFAELLERSSLGTPAARQIREQADRSVIEDVRRRLMTTQRTTTQSPGRLLLSYQRNEFAGLAGRLRLQRVHLGAASSSVVDVSGGTTLNFGSSIRHAFEDAIECVNNIHDPVSRDWFPRECQDQSGYGPVETGSAASTESREPAARVFAARSTEAAHESITLTPVGSSGTGKTTFLRSLLRKMQFLSCGFSMDDWNPYATAMQSQLRYSSGLQVSLHGQNPIVFRVQEDPAARVDSHVFRWVTQCEKIARHWHPEAGFEARRYQTSQDLQRLSDSLWGSSSLSFVALFLEHIAGIPVTQPEASAGAVGRGIGRLTRSWMLSQSLPYDAIVPASLSEGLFVVCPATWNIPGIVEIINNDPRQSFLDLLRSQIIGLQPRNYVPNPGAPGRTGWLEQLRRMEDAGMPNTRGSAQDLVSLLLHLDLGELFEFSASSHLRQLWNFEDVDISDTRGSAQDLVGLLPHLDPGELSEFFASSRLRQRQLRVSLSRLRRPRHWTSDSFQEQGFSAEEVLPVSVEHWFRHAEADDSDGGNSSVPGVPERDDGEASKSPAADFRFTASMEARAAVFGTHLSQSARGHR